MRIVKEAAQRRNEILDVAERLFCTNGYDNTSTNDILVEIGIARGLMQTDYPEDTVQMLLLYSNSVFDDSIAYPAETKKRKVLAFIRNTEILLHMERGSLLEAMLPMFYRK